MWVNESHLLNKFLTEKLIFCVLICASKQTENYSEELIFWIKLCCLFIHMFQKSLCNLQNFYLSLFRHKVLRPFVFCSKFNPQYCIFFFPGRKCVDLLVIFNKGREETFAVSLQNHKTCICIKYLTLFDHKSCHKNCREFYFFYLM